MIVVFEGKVVVVAVGNQEPELSSLHIYKDARLGTHVGEDILLAVYSRYTE